MKKLLFIALLMPLGLIAKKDTGTIDFKSSWFTETAKQNLLHAAYDTVKPKWHFTSTNIHAIPRTLKVFDNNGTWNPNSKLLMETDTFGVIHVYGDTLSVLKAIAKSYGIKIKPINEVK